MFLITCFAPINLVLKAKSKVKAVNMTAKYFHQDLSCINRLHHEELHFWQRRGTDCISDLASEKMNILKCVCMMLDVSYIQAQMLKTCHDGIVVDRMKMNLWRKKCLLYYQAVLIRRIAALGEKSKMKKAHTYSK